jgi:hypothetical protein
VPFKKKKKEANMTDNMLFAQLFFFKISQIRLCVAQIQTIIAVRKSGLVIL